MPLQERDAFVPSDDSHDHLQDDPSFLLTVHGYVHSLRRVEGDDGDVNQTLRWLIVDKEEQRWDVFKVQKGNDIQMCSRKYIDAEEDMNFDDAAVVQVS